MFYYLTCLTSCPLSSDSLPLSPLLPNDFCSRSCSGFYSDSDWDFCFDSCFVGISPNENISSPPLLLSSQTLPHQTLRNTHHGHRRRRTSRSPHRRSPPLLCSLCNRPKLASLARWWCWCWCAHQEPPPPSPLSCWETACSYSLTKWT